MKSKEKVLLLLNNGNYSHEGGEELLKKDLMELHGLKESSEHEKNIWPYKYQLGISLDFLIGKKLKNLNKSVGIINCILYKKHKGKIILKLKTDIGEYSLLDSEIEVYSNWYNENISIGLHPSRSGKKFWEFGLILKERDWKSMFYQTYEYRKKFEKTLNDNHGVSGLKSPIQIKEVREKISNTIQERYGVDWFLNRGCHYSAVTNTMVNKFGIENLFFSDEWQDENRSYNGGGVSDLEKEITSELKSLKIFKNDNLFYFGEDSKQATFVDDKERCSYRVDFFNATKNLVIEINGDYWHSNPNLYSEDYFNRKKNKTAREIWEYDKLRKNRIIDISNCKYIIIWEQDWKINKEEILNYIINECKD